MKSLAILGSTGTIGVQALDVVAHHPDELRVVALAANRNDVVLEEQARRFGVRTLAMWNQAAAARLAGRMPHARVLSGPHGLAAIAADSPADTVVVSVAGAIALPATIEAIRAGKHVALATKEILVAAGDVVTREVARAGISLTPLDSEHCALLQCLQAEPGRQVRRIFLTCSGGPLRTVRSIEDLAAVTVEQALAHPTWRMGAKISVDSATLANKGLEVIEAHWLFGVPYSDIQVLVHPESIVHAAIELIDGGLIAHMGTRDMRPMIQYALSHPARWAGHVPALDLLAARSLTFEPPSMDMFPCLAYAYEAGRAGGTAPAAFNAANEVAVERFLAGEIGFLDIADTIRAVLDRHDVRPAATLDAVLEADRRARALATNAIEGFAARRSEGPWQRRA